MPSVPDKIIDKKIATTFHYVKTESDNYELTDEMLLLLDDKTLNKYIPLRRLAPYREKKEVPQWKKKQIFKELQKELERKKVIYINIREN
jgi:protein KRI1